MQELEGHLEALLDNTKAFNGELQRLLRAAGADLGVFRQVKAATAAYLQEFLVNLEQRGHGVASAVAWVEERGVAVLHERSLRGAELPPVAGEDDDAIVKRCIRNAYHVLLTRGIVGTVVYAVDPATHDELRRLVPGTIGWQDYPGAQPKLTAEGAQLPSRYRNREKP